MPIRIQDFVFDEFNESEMERHGVRAEEVFEVLDSDTWQLKRNKGRHAESQPYVMIGTTKGGRLLYIPIQPVDLEAGLWRPATAFTP